MASERFNQATALRRRLGDLHRGATLSQREAAGRALYGLDDEARWPQTWRQSRSYAGNAHLCAAGMGVKAWLDEQLDERLYHGAGTVLRLHGPKDDHEIKVEVDVMRRCALALEAAGAVAPATDPLGEACRAVGGAVDYV